MPKYQRIGLLPERIEQVQDIPVSKQKKNVQNTRKNVQNTGKTHKNPAKAYNSSKPCRKAANAHKTNKMHKSS